MPGSKKVLIITYYWPPSGGAGVQRWLKFSKYLPEFGWQPYILTVDPQYAEYPAHDPTLEDDLHPAIKVYKTKASNYFRFSLGGKNEKKLSAGFSTGNQSALKTKIARFIRGNFFVPDPRKGWNKYAISQAKRIIEREGIRHIITTSPPHSTQLIGLGLKKYMPDINWIADFRDPWTKIYYYKKFYPGSIAMRIDSRLESRVLKNCDKVISVGEKLGQQFIAKENSIQKKVFTFYNGYDDDDFRDSGIEEKPEALITYVGTISDQYNISGLIDALKDHDSSNTKEIALRIVGEVSTRWRSILLEKLGQNVQILPYSDHALAIRYMSLSRILLLIIPEHPDNEVIITGKIFEYLRTQNPILCLGPKSGEASEIISKSKAGICLDYYDVEMIRKSILRLSTAKQAYSYPLQFSRKRIVEHLSDILEIVDK